MQALDETDKAWQAWSQQCSESGSYSDAVLRSLITLKALTYRPTGGIVAAPTTSLPETLGGKRNWDYRFCWLRDATFTLLALMNAGFTREAADWRLWLRLGCGRRSCPGADHVWPCRRAAVGRVGSALARGL